MKPAFCMEMLYTQVPFLQRLQLARRDGVTAIEFWDWRDKDLPALSKELRRLGMTVENLSGNRLHSMVSPKERDGFLTEVRQTAGVAKELGCPRLMLLVQTLKPGGHANPSPFGADAQRNRDEMIACTKAVAKLADELNLDFVIEPLNSKLDHVDYVLDSSALAFDVVRAVGHPRVKVLYDIYHMGTMDEDVVRAIGDHLDLIGHFHVADKPGRREPGSGKLPYREIFALLKTRSFGGVVGFECQATNDDSTKAVKQSLAYFV